MENHLHGEIKTLIKLCISLRKQVLEFQNQVIQNSGIFVLLFSFPSFDFYLFFSSYAFC